MSKQRLRKIAHMGGQWVLITDERDDIEAQSVICSEESDGFPHDRIKSQWGFGRRITQITFADKTWIVCMESKKNEAVGTEVKDQKITFSSEAPEDEVKRAWRDGERIAVLEPLANGQWVVVTEKVSGPVVGQSLVFSSDPLPSKDVQALWKDDKKVVTMSFLPSTWVMVAEKGGGGQAYTGNSDWPEAKIDARKAEGMGISALAYNTTDEAWAMVFDNNIKNQVVRMSKDFPEDILKQEIGVSRYGKRFY